MLRLSRENFNQSHKTETSGGHSHENRRNHSEYRHFQCRVAPKLGKVWHVIAVHNQERRISNSFRLYSKSLNRCQERRFSYNKAGLYCATYFARNSFLRSFSACNLELRKRISRDVTSNSLDFSGIRRMRRLASRRRRASWR